MGRIFRSFFQAGYECSTHKLEDGKRLDLLRSTRHDEFTEQDYARLGEFGIQTVREGIRWTLIEPRPGDYDFSTVRPFLKAARNQNVEIVWDLLHFGWPDYLDIFEPSWVEAFAGLAAAFARLLRAEGDPPWLIAPVNEISFMAWAGGDVACLNPYRRGCGHELKRQLVRGFLAAQKEVRAVLGNVTIVSPEPVIHIVGRPELPGDDIEAENYRRSMFESWDMLLGRAHPELGGTGNAVDVIGVNYYDRNQWRNLAETLHPGDREYRPFSEILAEVYERYRRPLFVAETGTEGECRPEWLRYIAGEVLAAKRMHIPVEGICLYPILNHPGWVDDRHCLNGLWDYADDTGSREIFEPLAREIRAQRNLIQGAEV
ncbi:MAG: beta-galactosidase [Acidobacteriota bacterium]|nr:beta-galactosidase [Acidobacteriota bacterium]